MLEYRDFEMKHARAADASYRAEYEDKLKEAGDRVLAHLDTQAKLPAADEERALATATAAKWKEYLGFANKVQELGRKDKADDARDLSDGAAKMSADEAIAEIDKLTAFSFERGTRAADGAATVYKLSRIITLALVALALALGVLLSVLITRSLKSQLGGEPSVAAAVARAVAQGDLSTAHPGACRRHHQPAGRPAAHADQPGARGAAGAQRLGTCGRRQQRNRPRQCRPLQPHRATGQRAGGNLGLDGRAGQHGAAERAQRTPGRRTGQHRQQRGHPRWRGRHTRGADHARHQRKQPQDRRHHRRHRRHRLPDQHPGAERRGRSRAGR